MQKHHTSNGAFVQKAVNKNPSILRFIVLFAGIGGFRSALEGLGHKCVFSSEIDLLAASAYEMNFGERPSGDITQIATEDIPEHDIICAGFPCQPFSSAGGRKGEEDKRGKLFYEIIRIVAHRKPRALILENVPALQNIHGGKTFKEIVFRLKELGYDVYAEILNAAMFGVPQARRRLFIVAVLREAGVSYRSPLPRSEPAPLSAILEKSSDGTAVWRQDFVLREAKTTKPHAPIACGLVGPKGRQGYRIYSSAGPACTLTANGGGPGGQTGLYLVDGVLRRLSQTEAKRAMGFPDSHVVTPGRAGFKQLGNSVCPPVVKAIVEGLGFADETTQDSAPMPRAGRRALVPYGQKVGVPDGTVGSCEYPTPDWLAEPLVERFGLETDVCASPANAKCARYYTANDDGLAQKWTGKLWMNPPYGRGIQQWIEKAWLSVTEGDAEIVVCLIPVSTGAEYWHKYVLRSNCDVVFLQGRVKFVGAKGSPAFDSAVVVMRRPGTKPQDVRALKRMLDESRKVDRRKPRSANNGETRPYDGSQLRMYWRVGTNVFYGGKEGCSKWWNETIRRLRNAPAVPPRNSQPIGKPTGASVDTVPLGMSGNPVSKKPVTDGMNEFPRSENPASLTFVTKGGAR